MFDMIFSLMQGAGKPGIAVAGVLLLIMLLAILVQGMKRLGCVDAVACPSLFGLAGAGGLLVLVRMMV